MGGLREVLIGASDDEVDQAWITAVSDAIERELGSVRRSALLVKQVTGTWFHATYAENRSPILEPRLADPVRLARELYVHQAVTAPAVGGVRVDPFPL